MSQRALFEGLVVDPLGRPVGVARIGDEAQYVVEDGGFKFHIPAEGVDRQVLGRLAGEISENREAVSSGVMKMLGQEDLFTKAAIDASLKNMDANFNQLIAQGLPESARTYMGMLGFRIVLNYHGEIERVDQPAAPDDGAGE
ncbi:MAG: hypothetical protein KA764_18140 [Anaerolineales bacterium]|nr:hypothetical protein [Anaerolineales bacterium]